MEPANCETNEVCSVVFATVGRKVLLPSDVDCGAITGCLCVVRMRLPPMRACDGQELMHGAGVKHCSPLSDLAAGRRVIASFGHPTSDVSLTSDSPPPPPTIELFVYIYNASHPPHKHKFIDKYLA